MTAAPDTHCTRQFHQGSSPARMLSRDKSLAYIQRRTGRRRAQAFQPRQRVVGGGAPEHCRGCNEFGGDPSTRTGPDTVATGTHGGLRTCDACKSAAVGTREGHRRRGIRARTCRRVGKQTRWKACHGEIKTLRSRGTRRIKKRREFIRSRNRLYP